MFTDARKREEVSEYLDENPSFLQDYIDRNPDLLDKYVVQNIDETTVRDWLKKVEAPPPGKSQVARGSIKISGTNFYLP